MITVGMPAYRQKYIGWLALEGLCRQKTTEKWELLIIEESHLGVGIKQIQKYYKRLRAAGCVNVSYTQLKTWVPLSQKYYLMAQEAEGDLFLMHAADDYSHPDRLQMSADLIGKNALYQEVRGYFYDILDGFCVLFDWDAAPGKHPCSVNMCYKMPLFKQIELEFRGRAVDLWIFTQIQDRYGDIGVYYDHSDSYKRGVFTQGQNNISMGRYECFYRPNKRFFATDTKIEDLLPDEVAERLRKMKVKRINKRPSEV